MCTIGDCYVAIGFNDAMKRNPSQEAKNLVDFGHEMLIIIEQIRKEIDYYGLNMRIGIHTVIIFY